MEIQPIGRGTTQAFLCFFLSMNGFVRSKWGVGGRGRISRRVIGEMGKRFDREVQVGGVFFMLVESYLERIIR